MSNEIKEIYLSARQKLFIRDYTSKYEKMRAFDKHDVDLNAPWLDLGTDILNRMVIHSDFHNLVKELIEKACKNYDALVAYNESTRDSLLEKIK